MPQITLPASLTSCSIYELVAYHDYFRRHGGFISCSKIESEISKRGILERKLAEQFKYYIPTQNKQVKMFNNT